MTDTTQIEVAEKAYEQAAQAWQQAQAEAAEARQTEATRRADAARESWQEVLDNFDPAALRADVIATHSALVDVAASNGLTAALVDHIAAILREANGHSLAEAAISNGADTATLAAKVRPNFQLEPDTRRDHTGRPVTGDINRLPGTLLATAVTDAARARIAAERQEIEDRRRTAIGVPATITPEQLRQNQIDDANTRREARVRADMAAHERHQEEQQGKPDPARADDAALRATHFGRNSTPGVITTL